jgi:antitoxin component YwqK of YwqJK toxin-antitoxin module
MMKWYYYILVFMSVACTGSITVTEDEIGADVFYARESLKPYSGKCIVVYRNSSQVKEQFTFKNGLLHGESLAWHKNGTLRRRGFYTKGHISGKWEFWDEEGNKTVEAHYKNDFLDGSYTALHANGRVKEKGQFSANRRTGRWSYFNEDGQLIRTDGN